MEDDSSENSFDITTCNATEKQHLLDFIKTWEIHPELWNTSIEAYRDKIKKNNALDKLLIIYKKIKPNSTRDDVKKKLNSLRTNFRKELKKAQKSKSSGKGTDDVYVPSSWTYYELLFLTNDEQPVKKTTEDDKENDEHQHKYSITSMDPPPTPTPETNKRKKNDDQQNLLRRTLSFLEKDSSEDQEEYHLAKVWAAKLKKLEPMQKLFAEKAINDILFEGQLGKLDKNSVKINEHVPYMSSSPLPSRQSQDHARVNYIPSPSPSPNAQEPTLRYSLSPSPNSIYNESIDNNNTVRPLQALSMPLRHHQPIVATGIPSQIILRPPLKQLQQHEYVPQDTMSQENYPNATSNVITIEADVHANYTPKEDFSNYFQSFK